MFDLQAIKRRAVSPSQVFPGCVVTPAEDFHALCAEVEKLREELQGANECLAMVCSRLDSFGVPMDATPPMNYDDAISGLLFRCLKEAGVFPGHPATVRYEVHDREGDDDWFRRVPLEAAEAKGGE